MKLVIDIPEEAYRTLKDFGEKNIGYYHKIILNGTPVRQGHWMESNDIDFYRCPECGCYWEKGMVENCNMNFCPSCGAEMKTEE